MVQYTAAKASHIRTRFVNLLEGSNEKKRWLNEGDALRPIHILAATKVAKTPRTLCKKAS